MAAAVGTAAAIAVTATGPAPDGLAYPVQRLGWSGQRDAGAICVALKQAGDRLCGRDNASYGNGAARDTKWSSSTAASCMPAVTYKSLSQIARVITGVRWNGPPFSSACGMPHDPR